MPRCPVCRRTLEPGQFQSNYCISFVVHGWLVEHPGSTAAEIARGTGIAYDRLASLTKGRELGLITVVGEEPGSVAGTVRYRYAALDPDPALVKMHEELR